VSFNSQLFLLAAVILTENSHGYEMRLLFVTVAMAVQTGSGITVEFLDTIRIIVAKYLNYKMNFQLLIWLVFLLKSVLILVLRRDRQGNKSRHPPHGKKGYCRLFTCNVEHAQCTYEALSFCKQCLLLMMCCLRFLVKRHHGYCS
jgi:hypothetical protein